MLHQQQGDLGMIFDAEVYDPNQGDGQLPVGTHKVIVERGETKATKAADGSGMLVLHLRVIEGEHQGATGPFRLNLFNKNPTAVEIAYRDFSAICHCVGVLKVTDSSQICNLPFVVQVRQQKSNPEYTEVYKILDANGQPPRRGGPAPAPAPAQQQAPPQQALAAPPWGAQAGAPVQQAAAAPPWGAQQQAPPVAQQPPVQQAPPAAAPPWGGQQQAAPAGKPPWA